MAPAAHQSEHRRYGELDGLRGLAALSVFVSHVALMLPAPSFFAQAALTPLHVLWDGAAAVDLFFVLSGFVLALPFVGANARALNYPDFLLRRAFRILPAYWASLLLALFLRDALYAPSGLADLTPWSQQFWQAPLRHGLDHLLLLAPWSGSWVVNPVLWADDETTSLNPVIWTLIVELRISLIYPLVIVALRRARTALHGLVIAIAALAVAILLPPLWALPLFVMGGLLARFRAEIAAALALLPMSLVAVLLATGLMLAGIRYSSGVAIAGFAVHLASAAGALILIALASGGRLRLLACAPILFLGRISYGFYLVHFPLLIGLTSVLNPLYSMTVSIATAGAASILVATFLHYWLEAPAQALARLLTAKIRLKPV